MSRLLCFALLATGLSFSACWGLERNNGIWKALRAGHFSGVMNEDAHVKPIAGSILAKGRRYVFMEFSWLETPKNMRGSTPHGQSRLLVFDQNGETLSYLGSYIYFGFDFRGDVHPEVRGKAIFFPYHDIEILGTKQAVEISFKNGLPPLGSGSGFSR